MSLIKNYRVLLTIAGIAAVIFLLATFGMSRPHLRAGTAGPDYTALIQAVAGLIAAIFGFLGAIGAFRGGGGPKPSSSSPTMFREAPLNCTGPTIFTHNDQWGRPVFRPVRCYAVE